jgi:hypothetical protein
MRRLSRWFMGLLAFGAFAWILVWMATAVAPGMSALAIVVSLAVVALTLHAAATYAESRGWIYYRKRHGSWGAVGAAMSEMHAIYEPGRQFVKRLKEDGEVHVEHDEEGDGRRNMH